ncbi:MAG: putative xanthine dehydrogenase, molybdenum-binding subunit, partial [Phycisphaerales bacterium]|nr:putative xanthine dehydrogenase, molybdenum-binding subunit [Phycisphaerales bacterium]
THENRPRTAWFDRKWKDDDSVPGSPFRPLYDDKIVFSMQPIALVVAESFQLARHASRLLRVTYEYETPHTDLQVEQAKAYPPPTGKGGFQPPPKPRGDARAALEKADVRVDAEYHQPAEHHNPMEMFASTVVYDAQKDAYTIYDKTQGVQNSQRYVTNVFGLSASKVRIINPFMGGGFGSGLRPQHQLFFAVMAAMQLKRSVRVELTRQQMFTFGHRPETIQRVSLGAKDDGTLTAVHHEAVAETSTFEDYEEVVVNWSGQSYACENVELAYKVAKVDLSTPLDMRAPGAVTGLFALESAMDELAAKLKIDPIQLRLQNYAETDPNTGFPFSSKELKEAYRQGAEKFGWNQRNPEPRSMTDGKFRIGYGMAGGVWDAMQGQASASATLSIDGTLNVASATADIGTGTYTAMTIIAADTLGLPLEQVHFKLGDSDLPMSPIEGGSWTVSSVGSAVKLVCDEIGKQLLKHAAAMPRSPLADAKIRDVEFADGTVRLKADPTKAVSYADAMRAGGVTELTDSRRSLPNYLKQKGHTISTHSAVFVEVKVDEDVGSVMVSRVVSAIAAGRIISGKTARSQIMGAVVWGISMALHEETLNDTTIGRFMNHDFAEYHIAVNGDVHDIDVIFVDEHDDIVNPLGAKGVGEIGIVGVAAAIANAVYHATGKRIRSLPITPDKLL